MFETGEQSNNLQIQFLLMCLSQMSKNKGFYFTHKAGVNN